MTINPSNVKWTHAFLTDLREACDEAKKAAAAYEGTRTFAAAFAEKLTGPDALSMLPTLIESLGVGTGGGMPDKMAEVNAILNAMPRPIQEELLTRFVSMLFTPTTKGAA